MSNNTTKITMAQDSLSKINSSVPQRVQNSSERISVCAPTSRSLSKITASTPTGGSNNTTCSVSTGTISACAPKSNGK